MINKERRDRPRIEMLDGLMEGETYSIMRRAMDRGKWRSWLLRTCQYAEY